MSSSQIRPAIDVAPQAPPRPTLALILALLAVPGSTVAWELPLGGLWIGLPLAIAAIVLGLRARREATGPGRATAAVVIAGLCIAQMAVWTAVSIADGASSSAATGTLTLKELKKGSTFKHTRNTTERLPESNLQGDVITFGSPLADLSGTRVGRTHVACITTSGARSFVKSELSCTAVVALRDGTFTAQFLATPADRTTVAAITGGTGAYANASGTIVSRETKSGSVDTVMFGG
jgi:hypothetical protein